MLAKVEKILYATDLSPNARVVFNYAVSLARRFGAEIHLLHVLEPLGPTGRSLVRNVLPEERIEEVEKEGLKSVRQEIHRRLTDFAERELGTSEKSATLVVEIDVAEGQADRVILEKAKSMGTDLIVVGTHEHSGLGRVLIGSVAQKVIHNSSVPVLLVPIPKTT